MNLWCYGRSERFRILSGNKYEYLWEYKWKCMRERAYGIMNIIERLNDANGICEKPTE